MIPMKQKAQSQGTQVKVDLKDAETIKCKNCGNYLFIQSFVLKKYTKIVQKLHFCSFSKFFIDFDIF